MYLVERHVIKQNHTHWLEIDKLAFLSKNLYNYANYFCRHKFFETGKQYSLTELYKLVKDGIDYRVLPTKVSKQIIRKLLKNWSSYFQALKAWSQNQSNFLGKPKIPGYKNKTQGRNILIYTHESVYKSPLNKGICHLSMSDIKIPTRQNQVVEVRITPQTNCYVLEVVYDQELPELNNHEAVAGIDLGLNNLVALTSNQTGFRPILINGRLLKAANQFFNKLKAKLQGLLPSNKFTSKKIASITCNRNQYVENYLHQTSRIVVELLNKYQIGTLIIGKNDNWKQNLNIGKRNNQSFTQIPHAKLIEKITYKCQLVGIKVIITEEAYTSKTSALDLENPVKHDKYKGRRVKRGLFKSSNGTLLNADINGATQIIRKVFPNAFANGIERVAVTPTLINPMLKNKPTRFV